MNDVEILDKINSFSRWHYQFHLMGYETPIFRDDHINRHKQRKDYFFLPLVDLFGGTLEGKRILDLGCNAGFWSLCAVDSGCEYVLGIDGRQMHIDQANFVFSVNRIEKKRYDFKCGDIFDLLNEDLGVFDIVLCLGLMYHINKPVTLLEQISSLNSDLLVIDTLLARSDKSIFEIHRESTDEPRNAISSELVLIPSTRAIMELVREFGYQIVVLIPKFSDYSGAIDYQNGTRRAFICAKQTDLSDFRIEDKSLGEVDTTSHNSNLFDSELFTRRFFVRELTKMAKNRINKLF